VRLDGLSHQLPDLDPAETAEWLDSVSALVSSHGRHRAQLVLTAALRHARALGVDIPLPVTTPYVNTIPPEMEPPFPGDEEVERRIRAFIRWNAAVMVTRANTINPGIGGHMATYASSASLYEVGFNHFFKGRGLGYPGDQVYFQGHASPGIYARAFIEGRMSEDQLDHFRCEVGGKGLSSYPHPRLMPEFWEYPTVSMGLGPLNAVYHARFSRYLTNRGLADTSRSRIWAFVGDGEVDEPETLAGLALAARERLDNLTFVVNCNLQRLDGPVRGNGKIIQELEAVFRGAGWNVIKVIWGSKWDPLLAADHDGLLVERMTKTLDGDYQRYSVESGGYIREHFFGPEPELQSLVAHLSDEELAALPRGGHDCHKIYSAYKLATEHEGAPTAVLAKTIKGWTLGPDIAGRNATHQVKKMTRDQLRALRDRLRLQDVITDSALEAELPPYYRPPIGSVEYEYLMERRAELGGPIPKRAVLPVSLPPLSPKVTAEFDRGSAPQSVSTTMAFARLLRGLLRDPSIGARIVPVIPDEARSFGIEALFNEVKIYAAHGQNYTPVDAQLLLSYAESKSGQILEEGITEAGSMASFIAAGTSYSTFGLPMIPFFIFYSMFGFQRVGDLIWAASDARARGFLLGATAGRTTLEGEGLQHLDGHSLVLASTVPSVAAYDPAFAYEMAAIIEHGISEMTGPSARDTIFYITLYNENYVQPPLTDASLKEQIVAGIYRYSDGAGLEGATHRACLLFSGTAWRAAVEAQEILARDYRVDAELYSVTSYKSLREEALEVERWNRLHPGQPARHPLISRVLAASEGPVVAVTDFMKSVPDQVSRFVPNWYTLLGTDGFGLSDARAALRRHFEVDSAHLVVATLAGLAERGDVKPEIVSDAITRFQVDPEAISPMEAR
jgi:pyruvate dehydrogenase E1 component